MKSRALPLLACLVLAMVGGWLRGVCAAEPEAVMAIDICIEPDAGFVQKAADANARLRKQFPSGFALNADHTAHITLLQRYVKASDLPKVYEAVERVLGAEKPATWKLEAFNYDYVPWVDLGLAAIVVQPTDDLLRVQERLIAEVAPWTVKTGTAESFSAAAADGKINQPTIDYVAGFVPTATGKKYRPHVTIGMSTEELIGQWNAAGFERFTAAPRQISVFQLGNFGTARKRLHVGWKQP